MANGLAAGIGRRARGAGRAFGACAALLWTVAAVPAAAGERVVLDFNGGWRFLQADPAGAAEASFDDRGWHPVSTPHTYNDTDTFDDWSLPGHRGEQNQWGGRTWYRKAFTLPESFRGRKVYIEFEAARQVAEVYLNGELLGTSKAGFTPFGFELTSHLRFGAANVLAVMCDNRFMKDPSKRPGGEPPAPLGPEPATAGTDLNVAPAPSGSLARMLEEMSREVPDTVAELRADQIPWNNPHWHPAHGGLYRNVRLHVTDPLHVSLPLYSFLDTVGPYVYATAVESSRATVGLDVPIENGRESSESVRVVADFVDGDGRTVLTLTRSGRVSAGSSTSVSLSGELPDPKLWAPDDPYLYRVRCHLEVRGETVDTFDLPLGIRSARWDKDTGFHLNGRHIKLHGWGQKPTDEWPGLGAAQPDWMHAFTLQLMKDAGANFVRWGHCAGGPASIKAADQLGLVTDQPGVDGEKDAQGAAWTLRASAFRDTIVYFRNNPSILIWEGGNQKVSREHAAQLRGYVERYDPHGGRAYAHRRPDAVTAEFMDLQIGTEGGREIPELPVVEGEYDREESPRRVWDDFSPPRFGYPEAEGQEYQLTSEQYAVNQVRHYVAKLGAPDHSGGANWIFSDSTSGGRVAAEVARASGEVDGVRLPKEAYFACRVLFRTDPQVHIVGHWTYPAGTRKTVYVLSNAEAVELRVNGRSRGRGRLSDRYVFTFPDVAWEEGEIEAVAYESGRPVARQVKRSAGPAAALRLTPITGPGGWRSDGADVVLFDVEATDAAGERVPTFEHRVDFEIEGPGVWRGGYNSGKVRSINQTYLDLEAGINRVAVRSTPEAGLLVLHATSEGLSPADASVRAAPVSTRD